MSIYLCPVSVSSPVNIPMGGYYEVYTSLDERSRFTYANIRKASYTGSVSNNINIQIILAINISVFKFCTIGGIFLYMFADSVLFDMMLKTAYEDGVDSIQELIDRDMSLGFCILEIVKIEISKYPDFQLFGPTISGWWMI